MLELNRVKKSYTVGDSKRPVLKGVTLNFRTNEFAAILGPSGSGKTTLLNIIGGLDHYDSGNLKINEVSTKNFKDKDWDSYRNHRIGFVFQSYNLIPHQTILQNVKLALTLSGVSKREATRRARNALEEVGLIEHIDKRPNQLSGGQMQRVAIARALVNNPDILLADEPTGALDSETSVQIMELLKEIAKEKLVVMVTHNPELAKKYATRTITLKDGEITSDTKPYDGKIKTNFNEEEAAKREGKTRMSFFTALSLSLKNLLTKKGRTILVAFAGSIGIIGIALILAVSTGFQNYIDTIQADTLTSYPLAITKESADLTSVLLNLSTSETNTPEGHVRETQNFTATLGNVATNDLKSFREYLYTHQKDYETDVRLIENEYSIEPLIYTIDATNELAKVNPSENFSAILSGSSMISSYTSVFKQWDKSNLEHDMKVLAGRLPENYNELVVALSSAGEISELVTYALGFHDTEELPQIISSVLNGETVEIKNEPLDLTYEDLMNVDLRLIPATKTYKYNEKYNIYEDMSEDRDYMLNLFNHNSEKLKIVGVVTTRDGLMSVGSGILYLPELITHIIDEAANTEIVQKQLDHPETDIFSNRKFGEETNDFTFEFSDLVSVNSSQIEKAFKVNLDQNAVATKTTEYMNEIAGDITADISPVETTLTEKLNQLYTEFTLEIQTKIANGELEFTVLQDEEKLLALLEDFVSKQDFSELTSNYLIPEENFQTAFSGLLKLKLAEKLAEISGDEEALKKASETITLTLKNLSVMITELKMKQSILTAVGNLTSYLSSSFANSLGIDEDALMSAFSLNFTEEELTRIITAMFTKKETTLGSNLIALGYQALNDPTQLSIYFTSFDGKTNFLKFIDTYNEKMQNSGEEDKVIEYSDTTGLLMSSVKTIVDAVSYVLIAFVSISLIVSSIMIGIITYISVYERTKEIGILRAIGASKHNISSIFNAETFIVGLLSGLFGIGISYLFIPIINLVMHSLIGNEIPLSAYLAPISALILVLLSIALTLIGGLIPAKTAAKKDPVEALRSE